MRRPWPTGGVGGLGGVEQWQIKEAMTTLENKSSAKCLAEEANITSRKNRKTFAWGEESL